MGISRALQARERTQAAVAAAAAVVAAAASRESEVDPSSQRVFEIAGLVAIGTGHGWRRHAQVRVEGDCSMWVGPDSDHAGQRGRYGLSGEVADEAHLGDGRGKA